MIDLSNRVALVTAAGRGLGGEVARQLARVGADVAITYLREHEAARALVDELCALGRRAMAVQADAQDYARAQHTVQAVLREMGALHVLVACAGVARRVPLAEMSEEDWDQVVDVSLKGTFNYLRAVAPVFQAQRYGKIVSVGSINGLRGRPGTAGYNAAKAGLVGLVKTAAAELGPHNVNVNLVAPGFIETTSQLDTPADVRERVLSECAIKRLGAPGDIAGPVVFLCSDAARHVTGQVLKVDAGQYL